MFRDLVIDQIRNDELIDLTRGLAEFRSFSGHERGCAEWLADYMSQRGLDVELQEVEPGRPNVIGRIPGDGSGASLMLNGHLDIDPVPSGYKHDPWKTEVRNNRLWGHGIGNMKAGLASVVHAAIAIKRSSIPLRGDLVVAGVVGELQGGIGTRHLIENGGTTDLGLIPEPSDMNVRTVHAGVFTALVTVKGKSGWIGGMHKYDTVNAVDKMADVLLALRCLEFSQQPVARLPGLPRYLIGTVVGGLGDQLEIWRTSYVPDRCSATIEVRMQPGMTLETALADIERTLDSARLQDPELEVILEPPPAAYRMPWRATPHLMPALDLPTQHPLTRCVVRNHRGIVGAPPLRVGAEDPGSYAGTDAGHLFASGVACLVFGPTANTWRESYVELDKLFAHARVCAACAAEVATTDRGCWVD